MNELLAHEQYVCDHLEDRTAARALVDHHQEALGVSRREALKVVATMRRARRNTNEVGAAAVRMQPGRVGAVAMRLAVLEAIPEELAPSVQILIVPGSRPPIATSAYRYHAGAYWYEWTVIVGARWLLVVAEEFDCDVLRKRDELSSPTLTPEGHNDAS